MVIRTESGRLINWNSVIELYISIPRGDTKSLNFETFELNYVIKAKIIGYEVDIDIITCDKKTAYEVLKGIEEELSGGQSFSFNRKIAEKQLIREMAQGKKQHETP